MSKVTVLAPGLLTTIQDAGRGHYQQFGIGVCGVMDYYSHSCANVLVGNDLDEAVLEATLLGPTLEFQGPAMLAITGGLTQPLLNGHPLPMWQSVWVQAGDILSLPPLQQGCRLYIAFAGGIDVPVIMGSKSTDLKARIGGLEGRKLQPGDQLALNGSGVDIKKQPLYSMPPQYIPILSKELQLRVILGPQDEAFTKEGLETFFSEPYTITPDSDRMGYRLAGKPIEHKQGSDIISDGIVMGAIQVPGSGQPIILLSDRQTAGGYTKIATVIKADLHLLGQARPGDILRFSPINVKEAQSCWYNVKQQLGQLAEKLQPLGRQYKVRLNGQEYQVCVEEIQ